MKNYEDIGIQTPQVLLPKPGVDLTRWASIACDQFTSQPEYWQEVEAFIGDAPSTNKLVLPEIYLETESEGARIQAIQGRMREYLQNGILQPRDGLIYVERTVLGKKRQGIMLALDLECYDYNKGSTSLIRATEGTIIERLPPRMKIRTNAVLEFPHILVLIDDPKQTVFPQVEHAKPGLEKIYDFDLMLGSGHLTGYSLDEPLEEKVIQALRALAEPESFKKRYGLDEDRPVLLFAMGDGNHSLATAKAIWEQMKPTVGMNHPARYALVEIENVHDAGLEFEPIHRVLFDLKKDLQTSLRSFFGNALIVTSMINAAEMVAKVNASRGAGQVIGVVQEGGKYGTLEFTEASSNLPVGTLQTFLDGFMKENGAGKIDYVHGEEVVCQLGAQPGNAGFYVPGMNKSELFRTVILDGALPRKTFSMGHAKEKRFYMEARQIVEKA